ncbi:MAG: hypothetical protein GY851_00395 [bacterium]|nr:hypothetical protein [bacterium]
MNVYSALVERVYAQSSDTDPVAAPSAPFWFTQRGRLKDYKTTIGNLLAHYVDMSQADTNGDFSTYFSELPGTIVFPKVSFDAIAKEHYLPTNYLAYTPWFNLNGLGSNGATNDNFQGIGHAYGKTNTATAGGGTNFAPGRSNIWYTTDYGWWPMTNIIGELTHTEFTISFTGSRKDMFNVVTQYYDTGPQFDQTGTWAIVRSAWLAEFAANTIPTNVVNHTGVGAFPQTLDYTLSYGEVSPGIFRFTALDGFSSAHDGYIVITNYSTNILTTIDVYDHAYLTNGIDFSQQGWTVWDTHTLIADNAATVTTLTNLGPFAYAPDWVNALSTNEPSAFRDYFTETLGKPLLLMDKRPGFLYK